MEFSNPKKNNNIIKKITMLDDEFLFWKSYAKLFFKLFLNNYKWNSNYIKNKFILKTIKLKKISKYFMISTIKKG